MPVVEKLGRRWAKLKPSGRSRWFRGDGGLVIGQEVARQLGLHLFLWKKESGRLVCAGFQKIPRAKNSRR